MKTVLVLVCVVAAVSADSYSDLVKEEWNTFKTQHGKDYASESEELDRMKIYVENRQKFAKHNQRFAQGLASYQIGQNAFADMNHEEFLKTLENVSLEDVFVRDDGRMMRTALYMEPANVRLATSHVDWTTSGAVTPVQDQQKCQCGWAFSATGAIEGQVYRQTGNLVPLSAQNLVDCSKKYGNNGCKGGTPNNAFDYVDDNGGIDTDAEYPYNGVDNMPCRYNPAASGATVTGVVKIPKGKEDQLMKAVSTVGPVSAMIDASLTTFKSYTTGVYYDAACSSTNLNHAVLIVGFGTDEKLGDYWIVKNSWGSSWGDFGYIKMARNKNNNCGIASAASYPTV